MGTAHAGHDQCARCYFDFVKPALQAERQAVKGRRALKRAARRGGILDNHAQQEGGTLAYLNLESRPNEAIHDAILDVEIHQQLDGKTPEQQFETVHQELFRLSERNMPLTLPPGWAADNETADTHEESAAEPEQSALDGPPESERQEHVGMKHFHKGGANAGDPPPTILTEPEVQEVITAYRDGMFVNDICNVTNIVTTTLYNILREAGVPLRTHLQNADQVQRRQQRWSSPPPRSPRPYRPNYAAIAESARLFVEERNRELESQEDVMSQSTAPSSNGHVEAAPTNGVVSVLTEWLVTYTRTVTETTIVHAKDFQQAANAVHLEDDGDYEVISVARVKH